jgi:Tfp pilus assembly protein FimT
MKTTHSFSLIELILTVAIISIVLGTSLPLSSKLLMQNNADQVNSKIIDMLRRARDYSMLKKSNTVWGLCQNGGSIRLFLTSCTAGNFLETFTPPQGTTVSTFSAITFDYGEYNTGSQTTITITVANQTYSIIVYKSGAIDYAKN